MDDKPDQVRVDAYLRLLNSLPGWEPDPKRGARRRRRERRQSQEAFSDFARRWNDQRPA